MTKTVWFPLILASLLAACGDGENVSGPAGDVVGELDATLKYCDGRAFGPVTNGKKLSIIEIKQPSFRVYTDKKPPAEDAKNVKWSGRVYANGETYRIYNTTLKAWGPWMDDAKRGVPLHQDSKSRDVRIIAAKLRGEQWEFDPLLEPLKQSCEDLLSISQ